MMQIAGVFVSKKTLDIPKVAERLAAARAAVSAVEQELADRSVELVLAEDPAALADIRRRLGEAKEYADLCQVAFGQAQQREVERVAAARLASRKAELRAWTQHLSRASEAADKMQASIAEYNSAWEDFLRRVGDARKLLTYPMSLHGAHDLQDRPLSNMVATELARLGRHSEFSDGNSAPSLPGSDSAALDAGVIPNTLPTLADEWRRRVRYYTERFKETLAVDAAAAPVVPAQNLSVSEPPEPEHVETIDPPAVTDPDDMMLPPAADALPPALAAIYPAGSPERAEVEASYREQRQAMRRTA